MLGRGRRGDHGSFTALTLVGALALGVILASDVFHSGANVEQLLFGSLLLVARGNTSPRPWRARWPSPRRCSSAAAG